MFLYILQNLCINMFHQVPNESIINIIIVIVCVKASSSKKPSARRKAPFYIVSPCGYQLIRPLKKPMVTWGGPISEISVVTWSLLQACNSGVIFQSFHKVSGFHFEVAGMNVKHCENNTNPLWSSIEYYIRVLWGNVIFMCIHSLLSSGLRRKNMFFVLVSIYLNFEL